MSCSPAAAARADDAVYIIPLCDTGYTTTRFEIPILSAEIQVVLRESMAKLVQHMADRLKEGSDGKLLRFKETTVSNLVEFLKNFEFRNVTDDNELQSLVAKARELMQGVNADDLRTTGDMRAKVQQGMTELARQLDTLLMRTGGRKFRFDDGE